MYLRCAHAVSGECRFHVLRAAWRQCCSMNNMNKGLSQTHKLQKEQGCSEVTMVEVKVTVQNSAGSQPQREALPEAPVASARWEKGEKTTAGMLFLSLPRQRLC